MNVLELRNRKSRFSSSKAPAFASASDECGSIWPCRLTRTDGICAIGVSKVLGWQPARILGVIDALLIG